MNNETDYLIIGSGIAGLTLAVRLAEKFPERRIYVVTKAAASESNTWYAQGGIAVVTDKNRDSCDQHIQDTLDCGDGLCNPEVVCRVVNEGPARLRELLEWGTRFDRDASGAFDLGREGGHAVHRVVHHKDQTGAEIERALLSKVQFLGNVKMLDHHLATDLVVFQNRCCGAWVLDTQTGTTDFFQSSFTILATGGIGQLYGHTTNPLIATGDGIAMASRAGTAVCDMEFIQFHPTAFHGGSPGPAFLISEAVRGFGAFLRNASGHRFMPHYDSRAELAPRDIVSRAIAWEILKDEAQCVFLDCTFLDQEAFRSHFPTICGYCDRLGIDLSRDWIPVRPAQHYLCGGVVVDEAGKTNVEGLLACGECTRTGLHGANRLASNSLLEAVVYSEHIFQYLLQQTLPNIPKLHGLPGRNTHLPEADIGDISRMRENLQGLMQAKAGIVRDQGGLMSALVQIESWQETVQGWQCKFRPCTALVELDNLLQIGALVVCQSLARTANRGAFYKSASASFSGF